LLPGSTIKGALRARAETRLDPKHLQVLFGPPTENASEHAGSVAITDARLLLLPVRSLAGTFAWVSSPYLLQAFAREAALAGVTLPAPPQLPSDNGSATANDTLLRTEIGGKPKLVLEEFDLEVDVGGADALAAALAPIVFEDPTWQRMLSQRLCVVHDDVMAFLSRHATDLVTRVSIDPDTGTAKKGQLWTEENLPAESVLVGLAEEVPTGARRGKPGELLRSLAKDLLDSPIQLGGKATVGRGRCTVRLVRGANP
jgi:CRISPR-associated protein Cmr4